MGIGDVFEAGNHLQDLFPGFFRDAGVALESARDGGVVNPCLFGHIRQGNAFHLEKTIRPKKTQSCTLFHLALICIGQIRRILIKTSIPIFLKNNRTRKNFVSVKMISS